MQSSRYENLKELREKLVGYSREGVERLGDLPEGRLREIEEGGQPPSISELESLATLYGVDSETLADEPILIQPGDAIEAMASLDEFREIPDATKARVVSAASAARDVVSLSTLIGLPASSFEWKLPRAPARETRPWAVGRFYAEHVRKRLRLGVKPIGSMRDMVATAFSGVNVLYAQFGQKALAGVTFADPWRGQTIVLNLGGKNENPCVRRFSLAHELCHLLIDWNRREPLATLSGFLSEAGREREQRANGFASRLLCPERVVRKLAEDHTPAVAAERLIHEYGLHLDAAKLYLHNVANVSIPQADLPRLRVSELTNRWLDAEAPTGVLSFPLPEVPPERRTVLAEYAAELYSRSILVRDHFAALLAVTPMQDIERVVDYFGLDHPREAGESAALA